MQAPRQVNKTDRAFWHHSPDALLAQLDTRLTGLTEAEAAERLRAHGLNLFEAVPSGGFPRQTRQARSQSPRCAFDRGRYGLRPER